MTSIIQRSFNLVVRTIAKPVIEWVIKNKKNDLINGTSYGYVGKSFVYIGQKWNYIYTRINRKVFNISNLSDIKELPKEKALEKGTEITTEILIYSILIFVPIIEWRRQTKVADQKEEKEKQFLDELVSQVNFLKGDTEVLEKKLNKLKEEYRSIINVNI